MRKPIGFRFVIVISVLLFSLSTVSAKPVPVEPGRILLNGEWRLAVVPPEEEDRYANFQEPDFSEAGMRAISVPSNWETAGFETAQYHYPTDYVGFYRRRFDAPPLSNGERLMLHFEGVLFGAEVWLNGERMGEHLGGFTGFEFDVTGSVKAGGENVLAVKVTKRRVKGHEFDCHDAWALSGIYRDVYLYRVPSAHLDFVHIETDLDEDYRDANLSFSMGIVNTSENAGKLKVRARLFEPDGIDEIFSIEKEIEIAGNGKAKVALEKTVENPQKWNAEKPVLYPLEIELVSDGKVISTTRHNVGFREVEVDGILLKINGVPVKLKGVNRHEISVERGRALTTEDWLQDIELMKGANVNAVRTSHYPPDPEFLDLCDRHGFYVIDEAPFGLGDQYLNFPEYLPLLKDRVRETIGRDRNHPSVIIWSLGNENPWSYAHQHLIKLAHKIDPTRPLLLPRTGFEAGAMSAKLPPEVDILAPHYPTPDRLKLILSGQKKKKGRPVIMTEYLHALGRNLYTRDLWDLVWKYPSSAGGFVWLWADQGIKRPADGRKVYTIGEKIEKYDDQMLLLNVWKDDKNAIEEELQDGYITDTHGIYGADGIVNPDRTLQPDYYEIKKIYTPIYIKDEVIEVEPGQKEIEIHVQNRYDFTNLEGMKYKWRLLNRYDSTDLRTREPEGKLFKDFEVIDKGENKFNNLEPHEKGIEAIRIDFPMLDRMVNDYKGPNVGPIEYILEISLFSIDGIKIDEHQIVVKPARSMILWLKGRRPTPKCTSDDPMSDIQKDNILTIGNNKFSVSFNELLGFMSNIRLGEKKREMVGPALNTWRPLRLVEMSQPSFKDYKLMPLLQGMKPKVRKFKFGVGTGSASVLSKVFYGFDKNDSKGFLVNYNFNLLCEGVVIINYEIHPRIGNAKLLELGVKFEMNPPFDQIAVVGRGPDTYVGSIMNTEMSQLGKMWDVDGSAVLGANKTEVRNVDVVYDIENFQIFRFEILELDDQDNQRNFRAVHDGEKTTLYFNPWVKHPSKKNSDPPAERMVIVKDGDVLKGRLIIRLIEE